jgi:hypothetical protein
MPFSNADANAAAPIPNTLKDNYLRCILYSCLRAVNRFETAINQPLTRHMFVFFHAAPITPQDGTDCCKILEMRSE